jgi:hypothetical protein
VWHSRTPAGVRCAHFPSVITINNSGSQSTVIKTVELTLVVYHVEESILVVTITDHSVIKITYSAWGHLSSGALLNQQPAFGKSIAKN